MIYLKIAWIHNHPSQPIEILSELDTDRYETRKVERFRNGSLRYAGPNCTSGRTILAENPIRPDALIELSSELKVLPTSKEEFERLWQSATISTAA